MYTCSHTNVQMVKIWIKQYEAIQNYEIENL